MAPGQADSGADQTPSLPTALIGEATRKAGLVWLSYAEPGAAALPRPAWHVWVDGAAYVVIGGAEQDVPGLAEASDVTVVVPSKDTRARIVSWRGRVRPITPADPVWPAATAALAAGRLNAEGGAAMIDRWARESTVLELAPTGEVVETADDPSPASLAARPRETTATTLGRQPFMLGGVPRRRG